jgi:hypothetical protein
VLAYAVALSGAFIVRGVCWEAVAWAVPVGAAVAVIRKRQLVVVVGVFAILVAGIVTLEVVDVGWYHAAWPFATPHMMVFCGADYAPEGPPIKITSTEGFKRAAGGGPVIGYGVTPNGSAVVGAGSNGWLGCQWQVFVAVGSGRWLEYTQDPL